MSGCGLDCIDKKTGMHKSSLTMQQSKEDSVFLFQMSTNRQKIRIDNDGVLEIKNAWVENSWMYDCIKNRPVLKKDSLLQFVVDGKFATTSNTDTSRYVLRADKNHFGVLLGGQLTFEYSMQDTLALTLVNDDTKDIIDTLKFWKREDK